MNGRREGGRERRGKIDDLPRLESGGNSESCEEV